MVLTNLLHSLPLFSPSVQVPFQGYEMCSPNQFPSLLGSQEDYNYQHPLW